MMKIEVLFPELTSLFADSSNMKYLKACLPEAEFVYTAYTDEPLFVTEVPALIYMGGMTERAQEMISQKLMPHKERLKALIMADVPILLTSNATEIFGEYIENEDGSKIETLGLYPFHAKRDMLHRFNCLVRGHIGDMPIVGFKSQFSHSYGEMADRAFIQVERGTGMNPKVTYEGYRDHNLFATYLIGPFLINNPLFTKYFIQDILGVKDGSLAFENVIMEAFERRLEEFKDPNKDFD